MHEIEKQCPELTEKTAEALDNEVLKGLFIITQRNNLDLCIKYALRYECKDKYFINSSNNESRGILFTSKHMKYTAFN